MRDIPKGMLAGLVATIVLSLLMVLKATMGLMPQLDLPKMLAGMMGSPDMPLIGWIAHFVIGIVVYGVAIAVLDSKLPETSKVGHGVILGVIGWLIMMVALMPMAGAGTVRDEHGRAGFDDDPGAASHLRRRSRLGLWPLGGVARRVDFTGSRLI